MELDIDGPLRQEATHEEAPARMGWRQLTWAIIRRPAEAMRELAAHPDRRWLAPLVILMVLSVVAAAAALPAKQRHERVASRARIEELRQVNPRVAEQAEQFAAAAEEGAMTSSPFAGLSVAMTLIGAILRPLIGALAGAAVLHFLGTVLGGQQNYSQMLSATTWGRLPFALQYGLRAVFFLAGGTYDPYPDGLAGLVAPPPTQLYAAPSPLQPVLSQLMLSNLWVLALFVVAVRIVSHLSPRKAITAVAVYVLLVILLGEVGVGVGGFVARFLASTTQVG